MVETPIESYLKVSESKGVDILLWLLKNRTKDNNVYITLDAVAEECHVTKVTVNRVFQKLYKSGFMSKVRNGRYQLHKI